MKLQIGCSIRWTVTKKKEVKNDQYYILIEPIEKTNAGRTENLFYMGTIIVMTLFGVPMYTYDGKSEIYKLSKLLFPSKTINVLDPPKNNQTPVSPI